MREWLKALREEKGLTMKEMGEKLDISESYYCAIENGARQKKMDVILLYGIATALSIPIEEAMDRERHYVSKQTA